MYLFCYCFVSAPAAALVVPRHDPSSPPGSMRLEKQRFIRFLFIQVIGMGEEWKGGEDMANSPGGGHKVNLLKSELEEYKDREDLILMFTDSYDVILLGDQEQIIEAFKSFNAKVVFGAEGFCWPDASLENSYPAVESGKRFLNSGGFIGYAKHIYAIINYKAIGN